jgi:hypothetical protein
VRDRGRSSKLRSLRERYKLGAQNLKKLKRILRATSK